MNEDKIILYTIHCAHCRELERILKKAGVQYEEITDIEVMNQKGFMSVPMLQVNDEIMNLENAIKWIEERKTE